MNRVSVIIPAHNAQATLGDTLASALASTHSDIEVLVVDDGSSDDTAAIAERFARSDGRVKFHSRPHGGVSATLNFALRQAGGDYIARLDSDDVWHPTKLEKQLVVAAAEPQAALIYSFVRYIDGVGRVTRDVAPQRFPSRALCRCLYEGLIGGNSSVMMRRSAVARAGGYDEILSSWEDLLLYLSISAEHPIAFVPEYLVGYRVRPGSLSADPKNMHDSWRIARKRIDQRFPQVPRRVRTWAHGTRMTMLAESFAWKRRYATSAKLLAEGLFNDPAWTSAFLAYRLKRKFSRRVDWPGGAQGPLFIDCLPDRQYRLSPFDSGLEGRRFHRFEEARKRKLAAIDEEIAGERR